jgi:DNA (cytosine-5)-methyltransferase 1
MRTLHLFAGAGGGLLADLILGHTPIGAVEFDPYCCRVLRERAADGWFPDLRVHEGDVRLFDPSEYASRVDCLHAGFPCQPHSVAGKRAGEADERNLWPDTKRIIGELRPRFALLENVPGIFATGYVWTVLGDLAALGYDARWAIISAADAGAPHLRERWWCLAERADTDDAGQRTDRRTICEPEIRDDARRVCEVVADAILERLEGQQQGRPAPWTTDGPGNDGNPGWWQIEPGVGRVVDGLAARVDRLKALGNGQVPLQAALAWRILGGPE